jgi:hypothetical protein
MMTQLTFQFMQQITGGITMRGMTIKRLTIAERIALVLLREGIKL